MSACLCLLSVEITSLCHHNCLFVAWLFYTSGFLSGYMAVSLPIEWSPNLIFICRLALLGTFLFLPFLSSLASLSPFTPPLPFPRGFLVCLFCFFTVPGIQPRTLYIIVGKCSTTELHPTFFFQQTHILCLALMVFFNNWIDSLTL